MSKVYVDNAGDLLPAVRGLINRPMIFFNYLCRPGLLKRQTFNHYDIGENAPYQFHKFKGLWNLRVFAMMIKS